MSAHQHDHEDDLMAIADAVGVTAPPAHPELLTNYRPHPSLRHHLSDVSLDAVLSAWSHAAAGTPEVDIDSPIPFVLATHTGCESTDDCDRRICVCPTALCDGHVDQGCTHGRMLCDEHRPDCVDCRDDRGQDATGRWS